MTQSARRRGFTLVEVLVALVIVAAASAAVLGSLSNAANSAVYLRDRTFAQWIALNRLTEVRTATIKPTVGKSEGEVEFAGEKWKWQQEVIQREFAMRTVEVTVHRSLESQMLATVVGIVGTPVAAADGGIPDWDP